ncbi:hypothetical protein BB561_000446 [Smittium simulii]|uniref:Thiolase N-terminal domain-containing protein n=1 Tax=Smittium simulii TaxID=133385 RepID=A0A2T9YZ76_9FUNG|nr:hypothetical protein BB561_000446 [Smittium simulii]
MKTYRINVKSPEDVVIVSALRTPMTKGGKGGFKDTTAEYLLSAVLKGVVDQAGLASELVEDIVVGNVLIPGSGAAQARMAMLHAGFSENCSVMGLNRQCASGLQAVAQIAQAIRSNQIDIGIGAGMENMSRSYKNRNNQSADYYSKEFLESPLIKDCLIPMGIMSDNVAKEFSVSREKQDQFSARSHQRAAEAQNKGLFGQEIIPVTTQVYNKDGSKQTITVDKDDGIRSSTTPTTLLALKPAFQSSGTTTAGNSSQISDGAAAVLLMKRSRANALNMPILGKYVCSASIGLPIRILGIGPVYAIPAAAKKAGIEVSDIDIFELNEAFASQAVYCVEKLGIDIIKVNPKGGAIALGHPLGATGARQVSTLLTELRRTGKKIGAVSMCAGLGMGMCSIFEAE